MLFFKKKWDINDKRIRITGKLKKSLMRIHQSILGYFRLKPVLNQILSE